MANRLPVLISALLIALSAPAQTTAPSATPADPPMPKDPNALMQLAARVNGLGSPDMKPWHVKANYQTFDADGKPKDQGVFEEWWASPDKYKINYTSPSFNQVQYHTGDKTWSTGDTGWVPFRDDMVERYLVHPLPKIDKVEMLYYAVRSRKVGRVTLLCDESAVPPHDYPDPRARLCFDDQKPMLRLVEPHENIFVLFNDIVRVKDHYVDKNIVVEDSVHPIVKVDVTTLDFPNGFDESLLTVPASAQSEDHLTLEARSMTGRKLSGDEIRYPITARSKGVQGTVLLAAIISKSGDIANLEVISGPEELRKSSIDAVKTWKYTPYLLNGQPVEVRTVIDVDYTFRR
jgi:TonB family protein